MGLARAWRLAAAALVGRFADARPVGALELRLQAPAANACVLLAWGGLCRARGFPLRSSDEGSSSAFETLLPSGHVRLGVTITRFVLVPQPALRTSFFGWRGRPQAGDVDDLSHRT